MNKLLLFAFAATMASHHASFAQDFTVSGRVIDNAGARVPQTIVTLLRAKDSSSAGFELTDENGVFLFTKVGADSYIIAIQSIGYTSFTYPLSVKDNINTLELILTKNPTQLEEVTVTDKRPYIETALGKTIVNVGGTAVPAGSNVLELLRKAPGVQVQGSDITLQGIGVLVLIDDKQTYLSGKELADYLQGLSAGAVAQIELITQPSSRYDAEGSGGIINIKTKRLQKKGFNGNISLAARQTLYPSTDNTLNLSYQKNKLTLYTNASHLYATGSLSSDIDQQVSDPNSGNFFNRSVMHSFQKETFADYSVRIGADYAFNEKITGGASVKAIYHPNDEHDDTYTDITDHTGTLTHNETRSDLGHLRNHYICNVYLKLTPGKDQSLTVDGDYLYRDQNSYLRLTGVNRNELGQSIGDDLFLRNEARSLIRATVVKCDYEASFPKDWKIEAGLKGSFSSTANGVRFETFHSGNWIHDSLRSNKFLYKENINAVYLSASRTIGKKWKVQAGLRVEQTNATGRQVVGNENFSRTNTALFPTAFLSYTANEKHGLELNCGRRISRPAYTQLNPFLFFTSQFSYFQGNPNLLPSYEWFSSLRHSLSNKIFTTVRYAMGS